MGVWSIVLEAQAQEIKTPPEWPQTLWTQCWNGTWMNFTQDLWIQLPSERQQYYAQQYQQWYAKEILKTTLSRTFLIADTAFEMILIPPGKYWKGSPETEGGRDPQDEFREVVLIPTAFWCGKYEVTQQQWRAVMKQDPSHFQGNPQNPVERVSWFDTQSFCEKAKVRLLTEAEWEYVCRAGTSTAYFFGDDPKLLNEYAWYYDNASQLYTVGQKRPNPFGLYDVYGNVWEWCSDRYSEKTQDLYEKRIYRGGGWSGNADSCRSADRAGFSPDYRNNFLGFRIIYEIAYGHGAVPVRKMCAIYGL